MKVIVAIKRVVDPYVKVRVRNDEKSVATDNLKMVINPFDEIALEEAIRWKEGGFITEIGAVSIGTQAVQEQLRSALALGADYAIHMPTDKMLTSLQIAKCLQQVVKQEKPDMVILGKQAIDDDCNQTGQMLSALLGWPQATFASKTQFTENKKQILVTREIDGGLETLKVNLPAIITTDLRLNEPRYATLPNIMQAKKKTLSTLEIDPQINVDPKIKIIAVKRPPPRKSGKMVQDVNELVHYLRDVEKVIA